MVALFGLTALAGVAPAAEAVQRDGDGLVGLAAQRAVAHGSGLEPLDNGAYRLHLVQRDAAVGGIVEVQQTAQMDAVLAHVVHGVGELLEGVVVTGEAGFLEQVDGLVKKLVSTIRVGEESGQLDNMLDSIANALEEEAENATKRIVTLLEPILICIMACIVGFIMVAVLMPIYQSYAAIEAAA